MKVTRLTREKEARILQVLKDEDLSFSVAAVRFGVTRGTVRKLVERSEEEAAEDYGTVLGKSGQSATT